jgi:hypothetical protein
MKDVQPDDTWRTVKGPQHPRVIPVFRSTATLIGYTILVVGGVLFGWGLAVSATVGPGVVVGFIVTLIGWIVSYRLSIDAQRRLFVDRVQHEAAQDLARVIREHSDWLGRAHMALFELKWIHRLAENSPPEHWFAAAERLRHRDVWHGHIDWIFTLEGYETLFPETTECRAELGQRERRLLDEFRAIAIAFLQKETRSSALKSAELLANEFGDQLALFEDLRRHVQNKDLAQLTGHEIQKRVPTDPTLPVLSMGADKKLHIMPAHTLSSKVSKS